MQIHWGLQKVWTGSLDDILLLLEHYVDWAVATIIEMIAAEGTQCNGMYGSLSHQP